jgi:hypothetical protein
LHVDRRRPTSPVNLDADVATLPPAAMRRLSNQIDRAYRGTYGAKTGLRILVRTMARQLLVGGSTPSAVARALEECVLSHTAHGTDNPQTRAIDSQVLVEVTRECVTGVATELGVSF